MPRMVKVIESESILIDAIGAIGVRGWGREIGS